MPKANIGMKDEVVVYDNSLSHASHEMDKLLLKFSIEIEVFTFFKSPIFCSHSRENEAVRLKNPTYCLKSLWDSLIDLFFFLSIQGTKSHWHLRFPSYGTLRLHGPHLKGSAQTS